LLHPSQNWGWAASDLVYTEEVSEIEQSQFDRPVDVFPEPMAFSGKLDRRTEVRTIQFFSRGDTLFEIMEPVTDRMAIEETKAYYSVLIPGARADLEMDVRNECRTQIVPGYGVNLHRATMRVPAMPFGRAMQLKNSHLLQWIGDPAMTIERVLHTRADLQDLWGDRPLGWRIPETFQDEAGKLRKRAARHLGAMIVFTQEDYLPPADKPLPAGEVMLACSCTAGVCEPGCTQCPWEECVIVEHDGNDVYTARITSDDDIVHLSRDFFHATTPFENRYSYCMETKLFTVTLGVGFADNTCILKDGAEPRRADDASHQYDVVNREYVDRELAETFSQARMFDTYNF